MLAGVRISTSASIVCLALSASCGAKSGLVVPSSAGGPLDAGIDARPDAWPDARADTAADVVVTCGPPVTLLAVRADVALVIDRSESMLRPLSSSAATRWETLRGALGAVLPTFDVNVAFGAILFPIADAAFPDTMCALGGALDVPVASGNVPTVLAALDAHDPAGGTPTADAISLATDALRAHARPGALQAIVLATDGGPNCDPADRGEPHYGLAPESCRAALIDPYECLDTDRTLARIDEALVVGISTYVIAMDIVAPYLVDVLQRMAIAGGRARSDAATPYYDVRDPDDLALALDDIATRVSRCTFSPERSASIEGARVEVDGAPIDRDERGIDGWAPGASGTIELFGDACRLAMRPGARVELLCE